MTLREPYIPRKALGKTAESMIYWINNVLAYDTKKTEELAPAGGLYKYLEDEPFVLSSFSSLVEKVDKMEKALEGYRDGKWAKEALE